MFKVNGIEIEYIFGGKLSNEDAEPYVSIVHSLDLDERFEKTIIYNPNPLFEQFPKFNFDVKNFERTKNSWQNEFHRAILSLLCKRNIVTLNTRSKIRSLYGICKSFQEIFILMVCGPN